MAQYVLYYALVAAPADSKGSALPNWKQMVNESDFDIAYHHIESMILDRSLYLWNKDNRRHLYLEVDTSDYGWGAYIRISICN